MKDTITNYSSICQNHELFFLPSTEGWSSKDVGPICKGLKGSIYVEDTDSKQNFVAKFAGTSPFSGRYYSILIYQIFCDHEFFKSRNLGIQMHGGMVGVMKLEKVNGFPLQMAQCN